MFAGVLLYSFLISDKKHLYFLFGGVIALYWILHVVACLRSAGGYASPFSDLNNLLRTVQLPVFALSFITFFKKSDLVPKKVQCAFFANMVIMIHSVIFSYMTGTQVYMYVESRKGLMGWATVHNAQSAALRIQEEKQSIVLCSLCGLLWCSVFLRYKSGLLRDLYYRTRRYDFPVYSGRAEALLLCNTFCCNSGMSALLQIIYRP